MKYAIVLAAALAVMLPATMALAATQADAAAALAAAESAEAQAGQLRNQWVPTEEALKAAKAATAAGQFDAALGAAQRAEALAHRSTEQAKAQDGAWTEAVIR